MTKEWQEAETERAKELKINPITGAWRPYPRPRAQELILPSRYRLRGLHRQGLRVSAVQVIDPVKQHARSKWHLFFLVVKRTRRPTRAAARASAAPNVLLSSSRLYILANANENYARSWKYYGLATSPIGGATRANSPQRRGKQPAPSRQHRRSAFLL